MIKRPGHEVIFESIFILGASLITISIILLGGATLLHVEDPKVINTIATTFATGLLSLGIGWSQLRS